MIFLRRQLPLIIRLITGLLFAGLYDAPHSALVCSHLCSLAVGGVDLFKELV